MREIEGNAGYFITECGRVYSAINERFLKPWQRNGYECVQLPSGRTDVHRLVAMEYVHQYDYDLEVNHIDGNKRNNHFKNLEWVTHSENMKHAAETGLYNPGAALLEYRKILSEGVGQPDSRSI